MPHTRTAKKRLRQNEKRRHQNRGMLRAMKTQIKKVTALAAAGDAKNLDTEVSLAFKRVDKAAHRRIVHPNKAARTKSQIAQIVNKAKQPTSE